MNDTTTPTTGKVATIGLHALAVTGLKVVAGMIVAHGYMKDSGTEAFIGSGMIALTYAYSFWCDYGADIAKAGLDILRARVLQAAAKAKNGSTPAAALASVTAHVIATTPAGGPAGPAEKIAEKAAMVLFAVAVALSFAMPAMAAASVVTKTAPTVTSASPLASIGAAVDGFIAKLQAVNNDVIKGVVGGLTEADKDAGIIVNATTGDVKDPKSHACYPAQIKWLQSLPAAQAIETPAPYNLIVLFQYKRDFVNQLLSGSLIPAYLSVGCASLFGSEAATLVATGGLIGIAPEVIAPLAALVPAGAAIALPMLALPKL